MSGAAERQRVLLQHLRPAGAGGVQVRFFESCCRTKRRCMAMRRRLPADAAIARVRMLWPRLHTLLGSTMRGARRFARRKKGGGRRAHTPNAVAALARWRSGRARGATRLARSPPAVCAWGSQCQRALPGVRAKRERVCNAGRATGAPLSRGSKTKNVLRRHAHLPHDAPSLTRPPPPPSATRRPTPAARRPWTTSSSCPRCARRSPRYGEERKGGKGGEKNRRTKALTRPSPQPHRPNAAASRTRRRTTCWPPSSRPRCSARAWSPR